MTAVRPPAAEAAHREGGLLAALVALNVLWASAVGVWVVLGSIGAPSWLQAVAVVVSSPGWAYNAWCGKHR